MVYHDGISFTFVFASSQFLPSMSPKSVEIHGNPGESTGNNHSYMDYFPSTGGSPHFFLSWSPCGAQMGYPFISIGGMTATVNLLPSRLCQQFAKMTIEIVDLSIENCEVFSS